MQTSRLLLHYDEHDDLSRIQNDSMNLLDPLLRDVDLPLYPIDILVDHLQHLILDLQFLIDGDPDLFLSVYDLGQLLDIEVLVRDLLFLELQDAFVVEFPRLGRLLAEHAAARFGFEQLGLLHGGDGVVEFGFGGHGVQQVFESVSVLLGGREQVLSAADFAFAQFLARPPSSTVTAAAFLQVGQPVFQGFDERAGFDEGGFRRRAGLVLLVRVRGLVSVGQVQSGIL